MSKEICKLFMEAETKEENNREQAELDGYNGYTWEIVFLSAPPPCWQKL